MSNQTNPLRDMIRAIVEEMMADMLGTPAERPMEAADVNGQRETDIRTHISNALTVPAAPQRTIGQTRRAPVRTATPAHYRVTRFGASAAGAKMVASLTPRLATTFKAIARRKTGLARPDISAATDTTPKQAENNVYGLQKLELIETFYPDAK